MKSVKMPAGHGGPPSLPPTQAQPPALSPRLAALRDEGLAVGEAAARPEVDREDEPAPVWLGLLMLAILAVELLLVLACAGIAVARWGSPDEIPGPIEMFAWVIVCQVTLTAVGLPMFVGALKAPALAARFTTLVPGVVTNFATTQVPGDGDWLEKPGVSYAYEVDGVLRRGMLYAPLASNVESLNQTALARLPQPGTAIMVRCHPDHPERAFVVGHEPTGSPLGCAGALLLVLGLAAPIWDLVDFLLRPPV